MRLISLGGVTFLVLTLCGLGRGFAQSNEAKQLLLNVEKLSQLKNILTDMKKGYSVVSGGYKKVKEIASGNFSLHEVFLDGLMVVSPEVKKYRRVGDIISCQQSIVSEYKAALKAFHLADVFRDGELDYLSKVYAGLLEGSLQNLEDLAMVITSSKLRMSDAERLASIDRIFLDASDRLEFLRDFNRGAVVLVKQREKEYREVMQLRELNDQF